MKMTPAEREAALKQIDQETQGDCKSTGIAKKGAADMNTRNSGKDDMGSAS